MLDKFWILTLKQKKQVLIMAAIFLFIVVYSFAISPTIDTINEYNKLSKSKFKEVTKTDISELEKHLSELNRRLNNEVDDENELRKKILSFVATKVNLLDVNLVSLPEMTIQNVEDFDLIINKFEIEGQFENLNKLLFTLERNQNYGKVVNATFTKVVNRSNKKEQLVLSVYIQSIIFK